MSIIPLLRTKKNMLDVWQISPLNNGGIHLDRLELVWVGQRVRSFTCCALNQGAEYLGRVTAEL